jgi:ribosomal protein S12 methylthiotransferase accessory factor
MPTAERLLGLVQPQCGLFNSAVRLNSSPGDPRFSIAVARLNNLRPSSQGFGSASPHREEQNLLDGAGSGLEDSEANVRAIAEGLERYSTCVFDERQFIWAPAVELGDTALDLDTVARCSETELLHPGCPIKAPAKDKPIRWVWGISLWDGRLVWIPAIMVYLYMPALSEGERFWLPISTGCAAHTTIERALVNAICEVVERDAISLTWLCRLPLPRIELDSVPGWLLPYLARNQKSAGIWQQFFDATSDIGVPTVYSVQEAPHNQNLATLVMCSTELDPAAAIAKVIRESAASRIALQTQKPAPADWDDFSSVSHGAVFMGRQEQGAAFDFLRHSTRRRRLSEMKDLSTGDTRQDLIHLIKRFRAKGMEVFAVDLSTDEAIRAGMRVVRVIVPALQPLSFSHRARYLGHPRLISAMSQMGYEERTEAEINPWPQPFA